MGTLWVLIAMVAGSISMSALMIFGAVTSRPRFPWALLSLLVFLAFPGAAVMLQDALPDEGWLVVIVTGFMFLFAVIVSIMFSPKASCYWGIVDYD